MCYKAPGPRCSNHAFKDLKKARTGYGVALKTKDPEKCLAAREQLDAAKNNFYMTPKGQRHLTARIEATGDPDGELAEKREFAQLLREEALAQINAKDTGDINHADTRVGDRNSRLDKKAHEKALIEKETLATENAVRKARGLLPVSKFNNLTLDDPTPGYSDYSSSMIPQADDLEKISSVVDAVDRGANTASALAESIKKTDRQGNYYGNAAEYVGLVRKSENMDGAHEYQLTENGQVFKDANPSERAAMMRVLVNSTPVMKAYVESGRDKTALENYIRESSAHGYEDSVVKRRAASMVSWDKKLNSDSFVSEIGASSESTKLLAVTAAERLKAERAAKAKLNKEPEVKDYGTCMKCFMKLPASGICNCDD